MDKCREFAQMYIKSCGKFRLQVPTNNKVCGCKSFFLQFFYFNQLNEHDVSCVVYSSKQK